MKKSLMLSAALSAFLLAENNASVYELGRIEVTEKTDISQNEMVNIVEKQNIKDAEAKNVVEALQSVPGVFGTYSGGRSEKNIRIRGFSSSRVPIYIDGIPVYVPYDRNMDLQRFTSYDIGEISVSKSYTSPMFGANTMGGAVNIITRKPSEPFEGEIGMGIMNGKGHEEFAVVGSKTDLFYGLLSVSNYDKDYYKISQDYEPSGRQEGHKRVNSDAKDRKLNLKLGFTPNDTDEYSFNYIMQRGEKGQPYYAENGSGGQYTRTWRWPDWDKTSYYIITKTSIADKGTIKSRLYYDKFYNEMNDYGALGAVNPPSVSEYDDYSYGGVLEGDLDITQDQLLKLSISQKFDNHKDIASSSPNADIEVRDKTMSIGAEYALRFSDKLTWVTGASYDKNDVRKAEYRNQAQTMVQGEHPKFNASSFNPQTALYFQALQDLTIYGSLSRKSNMPSLKQRYSTRFGQYIYNPNLKAERSTTFELGAKWAITQSSFLQGAVFYTKTDNYIADVTGIANTDPNLGCVGSNCRQSQNIDKESHKGLEISLDSQISEDLWSVVSYTYINARISKSQALDAKYVTDTPAHSFYASLKYSPRKWVDIMPVLRYESARYTTTNGNDKAASYVIADLKTAFRPIENLEIGVGVKNMFDEYYYYDKAFPLEGRSYYANIRYNF